MIKLKPHWCECDKEVDYCFADDDECVCGIAKHHYHCTCGNVIQVG